MSDQSSTRPYTIVVGVSETTGSPAALAWADVEAKEKQGRVIAVQAWRPPSRVANPAGAPAGPIVSEKELEEEARQKLESDVVATLGEDHTAEVRLVPGGKTKTLLTAAEGGDLLVVDAPRELIAGPMFAHRLVYNASCPVVVMSPEVSGAPPSTLSRVGSAINRSAGAAAGTAPQPGYRPQLP